MFSLRDDFLTMAMGWPAEGEAVKRKVRSGGEKKDGPAIAGWWRWQGNMAGRDH
jgi:hypothetical protein